MKHLLFSFISLLIAVSSYAHDVEIDGIYYNLVAKAKIAEVTYKGTDYYNKDYSGEVVIPETIVSDGITYNVTSIGDGAFYNCYALTSITIPNSVTSIGSCAFSDCM